VIEMIAREIQSNIRELEGAWNRVLAYAELTGEKLTLQMASNALADFFPQHPDVAPEDVIAVVSRFFGVTPERMLSKDRSKDIALPRQIAMYLLREQAGISLPKIGEELGGRDHTTVIYACDKVANMMDRDERLRRQVLQLSEQIFG